MTEAQVPLAIVGIGCMFPGAPDLARYWANLRDGVDAITDVPATHWDPSDYYDPDPAAPDKVYARRGGFLDAVAIAPLQLGIAPRDIEATDTTQLLALHVAAQALSDAGYGPGGKPLDRERAAVILGVTGALELVIPLGARLGRPIWRRALAGAGVDPRTADDVVERIAEQYPAWQENSFPGLLGNVAAGRIANRLDLHGTNCVVDAACASSLSALHLAALELQTGRADLVLAGGVDTFNDVFMYACFSKTPALSPRGDARPFDESADGTILGEGVGIVALKRLDAAQRDGDRIYAVVAGIGSSSDGKGQAIYAPDSEGQARALRSAYRLAGVDPRTIGLIEAHGTGTRVGDATEVRGLDSVFGPAAEPGQAPWCALGSVKSMIGHTKAAAGVAGLIKAAMALHHRVLPPTLKVEKPSEALRADGPFYVNATKRPWLGSAAHPRRAGVSAFGFGGSNFHCVLQQADGDRPAIEFDGRTQVLAFCGRDRASLCRAIEGFSWPAGDFGDTRAIRAAAAATRAAFDPDAACRLTLAVRVDGGRPDALLAAATQAVAGDRRPRWVTPQGIAFGEGAAPGKLAALLPGQGAQSVDMLRDLACEADAMRETIDRVLARCPGVTDAIYPPHAFDDAQRSRQRAALTETATAQPALGAVSMGAWAVLQSLGVELDAALGHSYGELSALCLAGRIDESALGPLSRHRGQLMEGDGGDRGTMLAVAASEARVRQALAQAGIDDLTLANHNAPEQCVISGPTAAVEAAQRSMSAAGITVHPLQVAAAFHSPLVAGAREPFLAALRQHPFGAATIDVYANATAQKYPADPEQARTLLADQLAAPVQFVACVQAMLADGIGTFLEIGPGRRLCGLVAAIAPDASVLAIDGSGGRRDGIFDLACTVGALAAWGHRVSLAAWDPNARPPVSDKPNALTVVVCGANQKPMVVTRPPLPPRARPEDSMSHQPPIEPFPAAASAAVAPALHSQTSLSAALQATQDNLGALMRLQEQTAELHRRFLDGQQHATAAFGALMAQQQALLAAGGVPVALRGLSDAAAATHAVSTFSAPVAAAVAPVAVPAAPIAVPVAPIAVPVAATAVPPPSAAPTSRDAIASVLLAIVADKTGYPVAMLELPMGLDADLGIDSIKRVEILSALRERLPDAPIVGAEQLGELQTLAQIVDYLARSASAPAPTTAAPVTVSTPAIATTLLDVVSEKTGYPVAMLELPMGLDADLGIDSIKRVEILSTLRDRLPECPAIGPEQLGTLTTLGAIVEYLSGGAPTAASLQSSESHALRSPAPTEAAIAPPRRTAQRELDRYAVGWSPGVVLGGRRVTTEAPILVTGIDTMPPRIVAALLACGLSAQVHGWSDPLPSEIGGLVIAAPQHPDDRFVAEAFARVRAAGPMLREQPGAWLASVSRLGGDFGAEGLSAEAEPRGAALAGLMKTAAREWPRLAVHALDLPHADPAEAAILAVVRAAIDGGPVEIGHTDHLGTLHAVPAATEGPGVVLGEGDVVLVTGGARGVTAAVAVELARRGRPSFVLVGRSPEPAAEPSWLQPLIGSADIGAALLSRATEALSPRELSAQCNALLAARQIRATLRAIESVGARALYRSVDVRDRAAVDALVRWTTAELGPVTAVVHGAGVLADKRIEDKSDADVARVYGTKVEGAANLLAALADAPLRAVVMFSSSTARFGRIGQADYAMANEVIGKMAQQLRRTRPHVRTVAVGWGPWDGGMVTPGLAELFAAEGVETIELAAGARFLADELAGGGPAEIVAVGAGSRIDVAVAELDHGPLSVEHPTVFQRHVGVADHPFLASHVLGGKAVLPAVMMVEWFAHAALAEHPGLHFVGIDELRIFRGVRLGKDERILLRVEAGPATKREGQFVVEVALCSGGSNGHRIVHGQASVVLAAHLDVAPATDALPRLPAFVGPISGVYERTLFHGEALRGLQTIDGMAPEGIVARTSASPDPREWMAAPVRRRWITDPLALDSGLQAVIIWSAQHAGAVSLPNRLGRYRQFDAFPGDGSRVGVRVTSTSAHKAVVDLDWIADDGRLIARLTDCEYTLDAGLTAAFGRNRVE